jgi:hypothetical protein
VGRVGGGRAVDELEEARRQLFRLVCEESAGGGAGGVDVSQLRRVTSVQDLRRDVAGGAHSVPDLRQARIPGSVGNPEVGQLHPPAVVHEGVLGLYVPVDDPLRVSVRQGFEDLDQDILDLVEGVVPSGDVERHPTHELGHQVHLEVAGDNLQGLHYVLVVQVLRDLTLPQGPRALLDAVDRDNLYGHLSDAPDPPQETLPKTLVHGEGPPNGGEAAPADHLRQRVTTLAGGPAANVVRLFSHAQLFYSVTQATCY